MNKISKKIVALVTMAAFVLTLVPFAAFAEDASTVTVTGNTSSEDYNTASVDIHLNATDLAALGNTGSDAVIVWAEDSEGNVLDIAEDMSTTTQGWTEHTGGSFDKYRNTNVAADMTIDLTFTALGEYTIYVAKNVNGEGAATDRDTAKDNLVDKAVSFSTANAADRSKSEYGVMDKDGVLQETASVPMNEDLTTTFKINDSYGHATNAPLNVDVYAIDSRTESKTSYLTVNGQIVGTPDYEYAVTATNGMELNVQFTRPGEYTLYAKDDSGRVIGSTKVTVTDTTAVDHMKLTASWLDNGTVEKGEITGNAFKYDEAAKTYTLDLTQVNGFNFNGIDKVVLNGEAFNEDGTDALNQTIKFSASEPNTVVELDNTSDNTSNTGTFETAFVMHSQKNTVITVTDEATGVSYDVLVVAQKTSATNIDRTKTAGYVLATTDTQWTKAVNANLGDAVEFKVTDEKGNAVEGLTNTDFVIDVRSKAAKSSLTASALKVVEVGDGFYTLKVDATKGSDVLTEGKYEVRVALNGVDSENDNATVTFNAAEFGKIKNVELNIEDQNGIALDDQITLDTTATVSLVYVDANGVKVAGPKQFNWNATNSALAIQNVSVDKNNNTFTLKPDSIEHQGVVGSIVKVQASVSGYGLVEKELTIVSSYNEYSMKFDPTEGPVNEYNKVDLSVLNSDGDVAKGVSGKAKVVVVDSSNEDAKVSVDANGQVKNGEGSLTVYASQETELELVVTVVDTNGKILAADTLNYTVGAADPLAGRSVVMTIGSSEYVVNNQIITGDAAPFVDNNWRTMVPIRALAEAFDAEVNWDNDARTVTINYDANTQIVMTIGEDTYTVNGADKTMDTEPVIQGDRTYVPIRFAAEALGFTVTPLYTAEGTTGSVVFQR